MEKGKYLYEFFRYIAYIVILVVYHPKVYGLENVPKEGAIILAGNHKHALDPGTVAVKVKRRIYFLGKIEIFKGIFGTLFRRVGVIPVDRSKKNPGAIKSAMKVLKSGGVLGIFPEGTMNKTNKDLLEFRMGTVNLAQKTGAKIVPFAIRGEYKIFRKGLEIEFGKPLDYKDIETEKANKLLQEEVLKLLRK